LELSALYQLYQHYPSVQTDTRKLQAGDLYFALKGPHFDGNHFALDALQKGAAYAVVDQDDLPADDRLVRVPDVLTALQQLARYHRDQFSIPFIAITGSNGKTTTKELVREVLSTTFRTYATEGNLNNHIGIPLTLLRIRPDTEMAVIEMGANHQREIAGYCEIVHPTHGLITNIGRAHLEGFGGIEGVRKGKGELFDYLRATGGKAFVCSDFPDLREMSRGIPQVIWYGTDKQADVTGMVKDHKYFLQFSAGYTGLVQTHMAGDYNLYNALAAIAIGKDFGVAGPGIKMAIEQYVPSNQRSQLVQDGSNTLILDAYNANPSSMRAAIENFAAMEGARKVLLLGGMKELGTDSIAEHQALVDELRQHAWTAVVLVGGDFAHVHHPYIYLPDSLAARDWYRQQKFKNTQILIKGSRSIAMEKILS